MILAVTTSNTSFIFPLFVCLKTDLISGIITQGKIYEDTITLNIIVRAIYISSNNAALALYQDYNSWNVGTASIDFDKKSIIYKII